MKKFREVKSDEWVTPKMSGYLMKCCDCGLVHEMDFQVLRVVETKKNGWWSAKETKPGAFKVMLRARRK